MDTAREPVEPAPTPPAQPARGAVAEPWWGEVLRATLEASVSDRVSLTAAGCAFYATLALFPAISILISIYGLAFNPWNVEPQLQALRELLPPPAFELIADRVHMLVAQPSARLSFGLGIGTLVLVASGLLDFYVDHIGSFGATYGPIGAVVGVMLWFFVSVYAVLLGAELNAQLEGRAGE